MGAWEIAVVRTDARAIVALVVDVVEGREVLLTQQVRIQLETFYASLVLNRPFVESLKEMSGHGCCSIQPNEA